MLKPSKSKQLEEEKEKKAHDDLINKSIALAKE